MKHKQKFGLSETVIQSLKPVLSSYPEIKKIILYGSRAKGNYNAASDIDLALVAPSMELSTLLKIENQIDDLLIPYKVDLCLMHRIDNNDLVKHIQRVSVEF